MNQDLENLIESATSTGVITDKARAVIVAKAGAIGITEDEADIYIESAVNQNSKRINEIDDRVSNIEHQGYVKKWSKKRRLYMVYLAPVIVLVLFIIWIPILSFLDSPLRPTRGHTNGYLWISCTIISVGAYFYYANRFFKRKLAAPNKQ